MRIPTIGTAMKTTERDLLDRYYTPDEVALACVGTLDLRGVRYVLEPSVGQGAWVRALRFHTTPLSGPHLPLHIATCDVDPEAKHESSDEIVHGPFEESISPGARFDLVIGNPPFSQAEEHVRLALRHGHTVAFLLRLAFLEGAKRRDFWRENPAYSVHVLTSRPSFTGGGTDSAAYGFFLWIRGSTGKTQLSHLDWKG